MISNLWEESYCEMEFDRSVRKHDTTLVINRHADNNHQIKDKLYKYSILKEEYHQMEMQKIITSKLLSTQSEGKLSIHTSVVSNGIRFEGRKVPGGIFALKEHTHHDNAPTSEEITKEIHKNIGNKTFRYEKVEAHEQKLYKDVIM